MSGRAGADDDSFADRLLRGSVEAGEAALGALEPDRVDAVMAAIAGAADEGVGEEGQRRIHALWLLRVSPPSFVERAVQSFERIALAPAEPEALRILALDGLDRLRVDEAISWTRIADVWPRIRDDRALEAVGRWLRVLVEVDSAESYAQLAEAADRAPLRRRVVELVTESPSALAGALLARLAEDSPDAHDRALVEAAQRRHAVERARAKAISSGDEMETDDIARLIAAGEMAVLHKLLEAGRVPAAALELLRAMSAPEGLAKSQRKLFARIKAKLEASG